MRKSIAAILFLSVFFLINAFSKKMWEDKNTYPIQWDGFGYYFYLPTLFYDNFFEFNNYDYIRNKYNPTYSEILSIKKAANGNLVMRYPIGCAILFSPAFVFAHFYASMTGSPTDGFSEPYQMIMTLWTIIFGVLGLFIISRLLRRYFSDGIVAATILLLGLSTNFFVYTAYSQLHSHIYLFTIYASILLLTDSFYRDAEKKVWRVMVIGILCGLATACRPTEFISFIIPLLWLAGGGVQKSEYTSFGKIKT
jgi:asparagine N-glycosylation enzyme membrane subunit Stt3